MSVVGAENRAGVLDVVRDDAHGDEHDPGVHPADVVALCVEHGMNELLTGDRDLARFRGLEIVDPFAG